MSRIAKYNHILTKEFIEQEYIIKNRTAKELAQSINVDLRTFFNYCNKYSIKKPNNQNITGQKFNLLTPIKIVGSNHYGSIWLCKCDCGKEIEAIPVNLRLNKVKSCGCLPRITGCNHHTWNGIGNLSGNKWQSIRFGAINRNIEFNITKEFVWKLGENAKWICPLSGLNISFDKEINTASIDRINSNLGYIESNIWIVHKDINLIKSSLSVTDFKKNCELINNPIQNKVILNTNDIFVSFYKNIEYNSKKRNIDFLVDKQYLIDLYNKQEGRCALTNQTINLPKNTIHFKEYSHTASLDRIDNKLPYIDGNLQWIHKEINQSRKHLDICYYKDLCKLVHIHNINNLN